MTRSVWRNNLELGGIPLTEQEFKKTMEHIVSSLEQCGYDPYEQLTGYITTGELHYITRNGNAREIIRDLDMLKVKSYVLRMKR